MAKYSKMHLFDVKIPEKNVDLRESSTVKAGEEIVPPVVTPVGNVGLAIVSPVKINCQTNGM